MRPPLAFALLMVSLAVLIGCKRKDNDEGTGANPDNGSQNGAPGTGGRDQPPPWPELPEVPARPKSFPNTPGGLMARALDAAAESLVVNGSPEGQTFESWPNFSFRNAFSEVDSAIATFPKVKIEKELYGPAGNATKERDLLDKSFTRLYAAWAQYWERHRRWEVEKSERFIHQLEPKWSAKQLRQEAERSHPPGREVKVTNANLSTLAMGKYDWYRLEASGPERGEWTAMHGGWVQGRIQFGKWFTLAAGPMGLVLTGSVGEEMVIQGRPAVIDLTGFSAPVVRIDCGEDLVVRVGPGVQKLQIGPRRGVVLARGAPDLRVEFHADRHPVAIVGY